MTNELREKMTRRLIEKGMSKAQATSKTAEACYDALMPDNAAALIEDASEVVKDMRRKYNSMIERLEYVAQVIEASKDTRISDEKAQNIVGLFASLLDISLNSRKKYAEDEDLVLMYRG